MRAFLLLAILGLATGCGSDKGDTNFDAQADAYDRQTKRMDDILTQQESELERYTKLLAKWEEQAERLDAILDADEKRLGIKPK